MARNMKSVSAPRKDGATLTIHIDPLRVSRGARQLPRGGVHRTARQPHRALSRRQVRRELAEG